MGDAHEQDLQKKIRKREAPKLNLTTGDKKQVVNG